ncbi:hypothetical protein HMPREF2999_07065 [Rothia sp. HMSC066H02]|nr:hypothetical protein HMPREF3008_05820 [Rothia sp. HMSC065D09]OFP12998.1 hypothetical protein HMPREF2999_07065 [Rothia sp. HMSC066H02]
MILQTADIANFVMFIAACATIYDVYKTHLASSVVTLVTTLWIHFYVSTLCWSLDRKQIIHRHSKTFKAPPTIIPVVLSQIAVICHLMIYTLR